jgi:hypothetical protein
MVVHRCHLVSQSFVGPKTIGFWHSVGLIIWPPVSRAAVST